MSLEQRRQIRVKCRACDYAGLSHHTWIDDDLFDRDDWVAVLDGGLLQTRYYQWDQQRQKVSGGYRLAFEVPP